MAQSVGAAAYFVAFPLVYALSVIAGRATRLAGGEVSLIWPAAAVGVIWMLATSTRSTRERVAHVILLGLVAYATNLTTGAAHTLSAWFALVNVVLSLVTVAVLSYRRGQVALRDPADLARLVAAVAIGTCSAAVLATAYFVVVMDTDIGETFALFAVRNGVTALLGVSIWLRFRDVTWKRPNITLRDVLEALLVTVGVVFVFVWTFWLSHGIPMAFVALVPAIWLTLRYSTTVNTVFLTVAGAWIMYATLAGRGPLIVPDVQIRALLAQAMVGSLTLIVLTLSVYRDSRTRLIRQLKQARDRADRDSELLGAVLDSIHDSVVVIDTTGAVILQNARSARSGLVDDVVAASVDRTPDGPSTGHEPRDIVIEAEDDRVIELATAPLAHPAALDVLAFRDVTEQRQNARALREARDLFAGVLQAASEQAIIGTDPDGRITVFNHGAERLLGWSQGEMLGRTPMVLHHGPEVSARAAELGIPEGLAVFVHNVRPGNAEVREWTYVRRDGSHVSVSLAVSQMTDEDGHCAGYIGVASDITERKAAEQALAESEERFRLAFDTAPMGMFMFALEPPWRGRITRCNRAMAELLGRPAADLLGMNVTDLGAPPGCTDPRGLGHLVDLQHERSSVTETSFTRADGAMVWGAVSASIVAPPGSDPYGICLVEDVTARKRVEAELQHLASHDPLTGLANRALFTERVEQAIAGAAGGGSALLGLIFLDLDGFKAVNDTWGHSEGDLLLAGVAERIQAAVRSTDTAARLGGDEFAVLCPQIGSIAQLQALAERLRVQLQGPVVLSDGEIYQHLSVSAGVVTWRPGVTAAALLHHADRAMYHAKGLGKNRISVRDVMAETVRPSAHQ
ncbi:diguanylate cyclase [Mycobacterium sp. MBM]|nr:diguanylate cyclase [Mycobacterium sp. MBM]